MIRKLLLIATPIIIYAVLQTGIELLKIILNKEYQQNYITQADRKKRKRKIIYCLISLVCLMISIKLVTQLSSYKEEHAASPISFEDVISNDITEIDFGTCTIEDAILAANHQSFTVEQLANFSASELRLIRNGIFATEGRTFIEEDLNAYYSNFEWYTPKYDEKVEYLDLNQYQRENVDLIKKLERILNAKQ